MSLRHCLSSDGSERGVPKEAKTLSKSMGAYQSLLFQLAMQFGGSLGVLRRVKIMVELFYGVFAESLSIISLLDLFARLLVAYVPPDIAWEGHCARSDDGDVRCVGRAAFEPRRDECGVVVVVVVLVGRWVVPAFDRLDGVCVT